MGTDAFVTKYRIHCFGSDGTPLEYPTGHYSDAEMGYRVCHSYLARFTEVFKVIMIDTSTGVDVYSLQIPQPNAAAGK